MIPGATRMHILTATVPLPLNCRSVLLFNIFLKSHEAIAVSLVAEWSMSNLFFLVRWLCLGFEAVAHWALQLWSSSLWFTMLSRAVPVADPVLAQGRCLTGSLGCLHDLSGLLRDRPHSHIDLLATVDNTRPDMLILLGGCE